MTDGRVLLEDSMRPVRVFLRCNGVLFDFLTPNTEHRRLYIARCCFTGLIMLITCGHFAFELIQSVITLFGNEKMSSIAITWKMALIGASPLLSQYLFFVHGEQFQQFFEGWKQVETQSSDCFKSVNPKKMTKGLNILKGFALFLMIVVPISYFFFNLQTPNEPIFLSYYPFFRNRFSIFVIASFHTTSSYFMFLYWFLGEFLFTVFFHHAGCVIEDLVSEVQQCSKLFFSRTLTFIDCQVDCAAMDRFRHGRPFRRIWQRYETVAHWVNRGNELFGSLILASQFVSFIGTIVCIYMSFKRLKTLPVLAVTWLVICVVFAFRIVLANRLMSHLCLSQAKLKSAIAGLLSADWYLLPDEDRQLLVSFLARLDNEDLAPCPMNLFTVNPTNLLTMLSLIVTYMVVIFQSDACV